MTLGSILVLLFFLALFAIIFRALKPSGKKRSSNANRESATPNHTKKPSYASFSGPSRAQPRAMSIRGLTFTTLATSAVIATARSNASSSENDHAYGLNTDNSSTDSSAGIAGGSDYFSDANPDGNPLDQIGGFDDSFSDMGEGFSGFTDMFGDW